MGKSEDQIKKKSTVIHKSPISMFWVGKWIRLRFPWPEGLLGCNTSTDLCSFFVAILGFIIFGGLVFEALSRFFS